MATHNQVNLVGYVISPPTVIPEKDMVILKLRTVRRDLELFDEAKYSEILIIYRNDEKKLFDLLTSCKLYDVIYVKGVLTISSIIKIKTCPNCGKRQVKYNALSTSVYPIFAEKRDSYAQYVQDKQMLPNKPLYDNYREISNQILLIGTVVTDPELIQAKNGEKICRYCIGVDRKYYIKSQPETMSDYPWIYSYGTQAENDYDHLTKGSVILVDGFYHLRQITGHMLCEDCQTDFTFEDTGHQITPYAVEYLSDYRTDEDILRNIDEKYRSLFE